MSTIPYQTVVASFRELEYRDRTIDMKMLKSRYHQLALQHHPDRGGSAEKMKRINSAYRVALQWLRDEGSN